MVHCRKKKKKAALNDRRSKLLSLGMSEWVRIGASTVQRVKKKNKVIILCIEGIDFRALRDLELGDLY